jgi:hypothetical protein
MTLKSIINSIREYLGLIIYPVKPSAGLFLNYWLTYVLLLLLKTFY